MILFINADHPYRVKNKKYLKRWLNEVIASFGFKTGDIQCVFCTDDYLLDLNRKYLSHDYFTDIITFDNSDSVYLSGDLFISIDRVKDNAQQFKEPFVDELHRVIVHGVLHLAGLKDKKKKDQEDMRRAEDTALLSLKTLIDR